MKHSTALAALVAATIGLGIVLPVMAQQQVAPAASNAGHQVHHVVKNNNGPGRGAGILGLVCSDRGAEALEHALARMSQKLELTAQQTSLFDAFKATALTSQTSFADACKAAMPDPSADARPDVLQRLKTAIAVDEARLAALNTILPDFEALYASLTDTQKADLMPGHDRTKNDMGRGDDRGDPGRQSRMPAPGRS